MGELVVGDGVPTTPASLKEDTKCCVCSAPLRAEAEADEDTTVGNSCRYCRKVYCDDCGFGDGLLFVCSMLHEGEPPPYYCDDGGVCSSARSRCVHCDEEFCGLCAVTGNVYLCCGCAQGFCGACEEEEEDSNVTFCERCNRYYGTNPSLCALDRTRNCADEHLIVCEFGHEGCKRTLCLECAASSDGCGNCHAPMINKARTQRRVALKQKYLKQQNEKADAEAKNAPRPPRQRGTSSGGRSVGRTQEEADAAMLDLLRLEAAEATAKQVQAVKQQSKKAKKKKNKGKDKDSSQTSSEWQQAQNRPEPPDEDADSPGDGSDVGGGSYYCALDAVEKRFGTGTQTQNGSRSAGRQGKGAEDLARAKVQATRSAQHSQAVTLAQALAKAEAASAKSAPQMNGTDSGLSSAAASSPTPTAPPPKKMSSRNKKRLLAQQQNAGLAGECSIPDTSSLTQPTNNAQSSSSPSSALAGRSAPAPAPNSPSDQLREFAARAIPPVPWDDLCVVRRLAQRLINEQPVDGGAPQEETLAMLQQCTTQQRKLVPLLQDPKAQRHPTLHRELVFINQDLNSALDCWRQLSQLHNTQAPQSPALAGQSQVHSQTPHQQSGQQAKSSGVVAPQGVGHKVVEPAQGAGVIGQHGTPLHQSSTNAWPALGSDSFAQQRQQQQRQQQQPQQQRQQSPQLSLPRGRAEAPSPHDPPLVHRSGSGGALTPICAPRPSAPPSRPSPTSAQSPALDGDEENTLIGQLLSTLRHNAPELPRACAPPGRAVGVVGGGTGASVFSPPGLAAPSSCGVSGADVSALGQKLGAARISGHVDPAAAPPLLGGAGGGSGGVANGWQQQSNPGRPAAAGNNSAMSSMFLSPFASRPGWGVVGAGGVGGGPAYCPQDQSVTAQGPGTSTGSGASAWNSTVHSALSSPWAWQQPSGPGAQHQASTSAGTGVAPGGHSVSSGHFGFSATHEQHAQGGEQVYSAFGASGGSFGLGGGGLGNLLPGSGFGMLLGQDVPHSFSLVDSGSAGFGTGIGGLNGAHHAGSGAQENAGGLCAPHWGGESVL